MKAQRSWISFRKPARKKGGPKAVRRIFERGRVGFLGERNVERAFLYFLNISSEQLSTFKSGKSSGSNCTFELPRSSKGFKNENVKVL